MVISLCVILWLQRPYFDTCEWQTGAKFKSIAPKYPWGHKNPENDMTSSKVIVLWWHWLTSKTSHCQYEFYGCHFPSSKHLSMPIWTAKAPKFASFRRSNGTYGTRISLDMTLENRSQVKSHSRYRLKIFREDVKLFKGWIYQVSWRSAEPFASYSWKTRGGVGVDQPPRAGDGLCCPSDVTQICHTDTYVSKNTW